MSKPALRGGHCSYGMCDIFFGVDMRMIVPIVLGLESVTKQIEERMQSVAKREERVARVEAGMEETAVAASQWIKFDVGGRIVTASKSTILKRSIDVRRLRLAIAAFGLFGDLRAKD